VRLYLSSFLFGNRPERLVDLAGSGVRAGLILNALDNLPAVRGNWVSAQAQALKALGFVPEEIDLRDHFGNPEGLAAALGDKGLVWITGGNAFLLRRAMRQSGFDGLIRDLLAQDGLVYAGFSAAACCAAPTLRGIELVDDPAALAEGYDAATIWDGLGLIDRNVAPHYRSDHPEAEQIERTVRYFEAEGMPYVALKDGQALVVDGASIELIG
jgi:dipeptidase E